MTKKSNEPAENDDQVECPNCGELIKHGAILCRFCDSGLSDEHFRECLACGEMVRKQASICRFCKTTVGRKPSSGEAHASHTLSNHIVDTGGATNIAQSIVNAAIDQMMNESNDHLILQRAVESLTTALGAQRGLIWQVAGDRLAVTNEYSASGHTCFMGNQLSSQESTSIVLEFLTRFPDESGRGVISVSDTSRDTQLHKASPTLSSLIELGDVKARAMAQLRSRGIFAGFLEIQQCGQTRHWDYNEADVLQTVAQTLSIIVQQILDRSQIELNTKDMSVLDRIASLFRDCNDKQINDSILKSAALAAERMGFVESLIFVCNTEQTALISIVDPGKDAQVIDLSRQDNPFAATFKGGRGRVINSEYTRKGDPFFGHETALLVPLSSLGQAVGVAAWWQRRTTSSQLRPEDIKLAVNIGTYLAQAIQIDRLKHT